MYPAARLSLFSAAGVLDLGILAVSGVRRFSMLAISALTTTSTSGKAWPFCHRQRHGLQIGRYSNHGPVPGWTHVSMWRGGNLKLSGAPTGSKHHTSTNALCSRDKSIDVSGGSLFRGTPFLSAQLDNHTPHPLDIGIQPGRPRDSGCLHAGLGPRQPHRRLTTSTSSPSGGSGTGCHGGVFRL